MNDVTMCNTFAVTLSVGLGHEQSNMIVDDNLTFII